MSIINEIITKAKKTQLELEKLTQEQVDSMIREIAQAVHVNAKELAELAVNETHMGNIEDKTLKNLNKSELIYADLKNEKTVGIIKRDEKEGIVEIAEPVGVVAAIIPCTNPSVTPMSNAMFAIKTRNPIIVAPHPRAKQTTVKTVELMVQAAKKVGLPEYAIQVIEEPSKDLTQELMQEVSIVLATGGPAMVKAAYSSGRPSYGVGAGNVPAVIHSSADIKQAVSDIIKSKTFDNGLICSSEQAVIVSLDISDKVWDEFKCQGGYMVPIPEKKRLRYAMFTEDENVVPNVIGQPVDVIAAIARITLPPEAGIKLFVVPSEGVGDGYPFSGEKMSPVLALFITKDFNESLKVAKQVLAYRGMGHTASIHCQDEDIAIQYAMEMKTSRIVVNQPSALSSGGSRENNLTPSTTLGCGTWGGNITSDNISAKHLLNIKRLAFKLEKRKDTSKVFETA